MFESDNKTYYAKREAHAAELASRSANPKIATIHHELALRYAILAVHGNQARPDVVALGKGRRSDAPQPSKALHGGNVEPELRQALSQA